MPGTLGFSAVYPDSIKMVSDFVFDRYKTDEQACLTRETVCQMMKEMYRSFNLDFKPTAKDIDQFMKLMDLEKNGMLNEKNVDRLARKHVAVSKYDMDKKYLRNEGASYLSISSATSQRQVETVSPLSQTQSINLQPLLTDKNFSNTANMGAYFSKGNSKSTATSAMTIDMGSKENFNPQTPVQEKGKMKDDAKLAFQEFDFNNDGKINCFECQRSLMRFGWKFGVNPTKINLDSLFRKADLDNDGLISLEEFSRTILQIN
jgi:Ca2+-binding EF-hand superfamily protein